MVCNILIPQLTQLMSRNSSIPEATRVIHHLSQVIAEFLANRNCPSRNAFFLFRQFPWPRSGTRTTLGSNWSNDEVSASSWRSRLDQSKIREKIGITGRLLDVVRTGNPPNLSTYWPSPGVDVVQSWWFGNPRRHTIATWVTFYIVKVSFSTQPPLQKKWRFLHRWWRSCRQLRLLLLLHSSENL